MQTPPLNPPMYLGRLLLNSEPAIFDELLAPNCIESFKTASALFESSFYCAVCYRSAIGASKVVLYCIEWRSMSKGTVRRNGVTDP